MWERRSCGSVACVAIVEVAKQSRRRQLLLHRLKRLLLVLSAAGSRRGLPRPSMGSYLRHPWRRKPCAEAGQGQALARGGSDNEASPAVMSDPPPGTEAMDVLRQRLDPTYALPYALRTKSPSGPRSIRFPNLTSAGISHADEFAGGESLGGDHRGDELTRNIPDSMLSGDRRRASTAVTAFCLLAKSYE